MGGASRQELISLGFLVPSAEFKPPKPFAWSVGEANKTVLQQLKSMFKKDFKAEICL